MIESSSAINDHLLLPPERFYWALLDGSVIRGGGRGGRRRDRLGYLFENVLPLPIEQVHAIYLRLPQGKHHLACGMGRENLRQEIDGHAGALVHLGPSAMPEFLVEQLGDKDSVPLERMNLLDGEYEPTTIRGLRHRLMLLIAALLVACTALSIIGLERRTAAAHTEAELFNQARGSLLKQVLSPNGNVNQPADLRMTAELRRLRQSRGNPGASTTDLQVDDCVPILADLLKHWPSDVLMLTESVTVTPESISIRGSTPGSQDVQMLANALGGLHGWQMQQPQVSSAPGGPGGGGGGKDGVQASLQLTREIQSVKGGAS